MRNARQPIGKRIGAGKHREHAGHGARRSDIDAADQCMGMRRAHRRAVSLIREIEIVAVATTAGEEAQILLAAYRVPMPACMMGWVHDWMWRAS